MKTGSQEVLCPWSSVGAVKGKRFVSWHSCCSSFWPLFPVPSIYSSFASPTAGPLPFNSLGVQLSSEASLPSWPIKESPGTACVIGMKCHFGVEPCRQICPRPIYVLFIEEKIYLSPPQIALESVYSMPLYTSYWTLANSPGSEYSHLICRPRAVPDPGGPWLTGARVGSPKTWLFNYMASTSCRAVRDITPAHVDVSLQ